MAAGSIGPTPDVGSGRTSIATLAASDGRENASTGALSFNYAIARETSGGML